MSAEPPDIRASDEERERIATRLRDAAAEGRLTVEELTGRLEAAYAATTRAELERLIADLPAAAPAAGPSSAPRGSRFILGILGGGDRRGRWRVAENVTVVNILGGADLDLREAVLDSPQRTTITVWSLLGGSDISVPEGMVVETSGFALLGGDDVDVHGPPPPPGAPVLHVRSYSLLGGTDVKTARSSRPRLLGRPPRAPRLP